MQLLPMAFFYAFHFILVEIGSGMMAEQRRYSWQALKPRGSKIMPLAA
jgi:hypothetical protein